MILPAERFTPQGPGVILSAGKIIEKVEEKAVLFANYLHLDRDGTQKDSS
jgi:hypothetical protein